MLFKLIYKDKSPEVKRTVELEGIYTLEEAREKRAWLKESYNWYSPNVRVLIERVE